MFDIAVSSEITRSGPYFTDYNYDYKDLEANKIIKKIVPQQIIPERTVVTLEECKHDFKVWSEVKNINLFKLLGECISKEIAVLNKQLDYYNRLSEEDKYHIETGKFFNHLI